MHRASADCDRLTHFREIVNQYNYIGGF